MTRPVPHDPEAEASVIASCAAPGAFGLPGVAEALVRLRPEHFLVPRHREVWAALKAIWAEGGESDALVLKAWLEAQGRLEPVGGYAGLVEVLAASEVGRPQVLAELLLDRWRRREWLKLAGAAERCAADLASPESELGQRVSEGMRRIQSGQAVRRRNGIQILERMEGMQPFAAGGSVDPVITFGLDRFDEVLERAPGQVLVVAARPGVGKTALMIQGFGKSLQGGQKGLFVSLELDEAELEARVASWITETPAKAFRQGWYTDHDIRKGQLHQAALARASYVCVPSLTPWSIIEAEIRAAVLQEGVSSVWLDYFTVIQKPNGQKGQTDAALWGQLSTQIRSLAQQLGVVIVLASQMNRGSTEYEEPGLSDLRETGQLEQDAHAVLFLWKGKEGGSEYPLAKLAKNRAGAKVPKTRLDCDYPTNRWRVETRETEPAACGSGRRSL